MSARRGAIETELKLAAAPRVLARLASDRLLGAPHGPPLELTAIYFDTPRHSLWRNGFTLRLRRERGRWVQTLKDAGALEGGLHRRREFSAPTSRARPLLSLIGETEIREQVAKVIRKAPLVPVFRVQVTRETRIVAPRPGAAIEVSFDRGNILAGDERSPVSEIELELKRGEAGHLFDLALAVCERSTARIEARSKAERGYALAGVTRPAPVRSRLALSRRGIPARAALKELCVSGLNHLQANHPGVMRGTDPEYLHQARVALRRLQAGLAAFKRLRPRGALEPQIEAVHEFLRLLGPARDWDVYARHTLAPVLEQFHGHAGLAALARATERLRQESQRATQRIFAARRYQRLVLGLDAWLAHEAWLAEATASERRAWDADTGELAIKVLERYHRRVRKRGKKIDTAPPKQLHRLRIATKKLRYAAIFFAPIFPRDRSAPMLAALHDLQDVLGAINDCATAPALLEQSMRASRGTLRAQARAIVQHWNASQLEERKRELPAAWKAFRQAHKFWR